MAFLKRRFKDRQLLQLPGKVFRAFRGDLAVGLPIDGLCEAELLHHSLNDAESTSIGRVNSVNSSY